MYNRISEVLNAQWLIYKEVILNYVPIFISFLNGNQLSAFNTQENTAEKKPNVLANAYSTVDRWDLSDVDIPENSIAIIPISGILYSWYTIRIVEYIKEASNNPRISSILFIVNSPGGMAFYVDTAAKVIKDLNIPTVAFVMNMCASATMWMISPCDRIISSSELNLIGSIGAKTSFTDINGFLKEKLGLNIYEIYATKSSRKDEEIRELLKGNDQLIKDKLDYANEFFFKAIQENLGIAKDSEVFTGAVYYTLEAITHGLCHELGTIEHALEVATQLGAKNKINSFINQ